jgi:N utilization substance protein B
MGRRRKGREIAVQVLYGIDLAGNGPEGTFDRLIGNFEVEPAAADFARSLVRGVTEHRDKMDSLIAEVSEHWRLDRMAVVDRNILRLAAYELIYRPDVPPAVILNEAIEIAKEYGSADSAAFINGVLDRVAAVIKERSGEGTP